MPEALGQFWIWLEEAVEDRWVPIILASSYLLAKILLRQFAMCLFPPAPPIREMMAWLGVDLLVLTGASSVAAQLGGRFAVTDLAAALWYTVVVLDLILVYCLYLAFRKRLVATPKLLRTYVYPWFMIFLGLGPYLSIFGLLVRADARLPGT